MVSLARAMRLNTSAISPYTPSALGSSRTLKSPASRLLRACRRTTSWSVNRMPIDSPPALPRREEQLFHTWVTALPRSFSVVHRLPSPPPRRLVVRSVLCAGESVRSFTHDRRETRDAGVRARVMLVAHARADDDKG